MDALVVPALNFYELENCLLEKSFKIKNRKMKRLKFLAKKYLKILKPQQKNLQKSNLSKI